jgi:hypothetical protein
MNNLKKYVNTQRFTGKSGLPPEYIKVTVEMKYGESICPLSWSVPYRTTLYVTVNRVKGGGCIPPTLTSQG